MAPPASASRSGFDAGSGGIPVLLKSPYWYMPWAPLVCYCFMLIGVGLWVHYTLVLYYSGIQGMQILGVSGARQNNGGVASFTQIFTSLTATSIVFLLFGTGILALGTWRSWQAAEQDLKGKLHEHTGPTLFTLVLLQFAWWVILLWLVVMMLGDAVVIAWCWTILNGIIASINAQVIYGLVHPPPSPSTNVYVCPATCYSANSMPVFGLTNSNGVFSPVGCICDITTLRAAEAAFQTAYNGSGGLLTGVFFMYVFGNFLVYYMSALFSRIRCEGDFAERLTGTVENYKHEA